MTSCAAPRSVRRRLLGALFFALVIMEGMIGAGVHVVPSYAMTNRHGKRCKRAQLLLSSR